MTDDKIESAYSRLQEENRLSEGAKQQGDLSDRRRQPRLRVDGGDIQVNADPWVILIDFSSSGLAYHSDTPHDIGIQVTIGLDDGFTVAAEVVQLQAEDMSGTEALLGRFRVSCRFADPSQGRELAVRIKALEESRLEVL